MEARPAAEEESEVASSSQNLAESRIGRVIGGRLTLERVLGVGGTAAVYAARHRNGRALAVKILHPQFAHHVEIRQRFLAEGYAANRVDHPDAVAVLDEGEEPDGSAFLVMELLRGRTFQDRLNQGGPLSPAAVVSMALSVLNVLAQAHERGVVHRDVKPSNVFETEAGAIKLLDFGIARVQEGKGAFLTRPGTTLGTPAFMAPELAAGKLEQLDALTDLWALGATMFQLLTEEVVHPSSNDNELLVLAATVPARPLASLRPDLPPALLNVIDRALAFDRRERWPNARAMAGALSAAAERAGLLENPAATLILVPEQAATAPEMALPASRPGAHSLSTGVRWAAGIALLLAVVGTLLATQYRLRDDVQARSGQALPPPAPPQLKSAASVAPLGVVSVERPAASAAPALVEPEPVKPATRPAPSQPARATASGKSTAHPAKAAPSAAPAATPKNPLFFPGQ